MSDKKYHKIYGKEDGERLESRILEENIQDAVSKGHRNIQVSGFGQHGIGGRLWAAGDEPVNIRITGQSGQRAGSLGFPNTSIEIMGPASDDVGWLNAGAKIVVHGHASNGLANGMAQGKVYVGGNIGARGMTMTKRNPRFEPPEVWVLGSVGDYFGEFMAGGVAVICGIDAQTPDNILGYRPLVGMVGGKAFFHGPHKGYSTADAKEIPISDADWKWLKVNLKVYLKQIKRDERYEELSDRNGWQLIVARTPQEKMGRKTLSMGAFHADVWDKELGRGGLIGDLTDSDRGVVPLIPTGELRRQVPVWENRLYKAPCEGTCPTGIPVQERWQLVREGRVDEAVDLALAYTPFPATVCGYLCPNPCMSACTRQSAFMAPIDVRQLGKASIDAKAPELPELSGKKIAVVGGGPAGLSVAWQLRQAGHEATVYDTYESLGGKIASVIPESRIPKEVLGAELSRLADAIPHVHLQQDLTQQEMVAMRDDYDFVVVATGAQNPRIIPVLGKERMVSSLDFLAGAKKNEINPGKSVVIIGAGNVGCDIATEAYRLGAETVTLIDVQKPAAFGAERDEAEEHGATFRWPCFTKEVTDEGVLLADGELLPADTVVISIGDAPETGFLPKEVATERGYVTVDENHQTTDSKIFAIGDIVRPGLLTDAIGAGRKAATAIAEIIGGRRPMGDGREIIDRSRVTLEYFDPRLSTFGGMDQCGDQCSSCGNCRDCSLCVALCPKAAIERVDTASGYEYVVDENKCIGCGFCAGGCPCGIWNLVANDPMD